MSRAGGLWREKGLEVGQLAKWGVPVVTTWFGVITCEVYPRHVTYY